MSSLPVGILTSGGKFLNGLKLRIATSALAMIDSSMQKSLLVDANKEMFAKLRNENEQKFSGQEQLIRELKGTKSDLEQKLFKMDQQMHEKSNEISNLTSQLKDEIKNKTQSKSYTTGLEIQLKTIDQELTKAKTEAKASSKAADVVVHPIFGLLLRDFGFKQTYAMDAIKLTKKVPIWQRQRHFRIDRAKAIAEAKSQDNKFGMPGVITLFDLSGEIGIIDGQHRVGAIKMMLDTAVMSEKTPVLVEVFPIKEKNDATELFLEINQAEPVKDIDRPNTIDNEQDVRLREVIDHCCHALEAKYKPMFSASHNCNVPHVNIDSLRQALFDSSVVNDKYEIMMKNNKSLEEMQAELASWIEECNKVYSSKKVAKLKEELMQGPLRRRKNLDKILKKCEKNDFYLGLEKNWY